MKYNYSVTGAEHLVGTEVGDKLDSIINKLNSSEQGCGVILPSTIKLVAEEIIE